MWKAKNAFVEYASYFASKYLTEIRDFYYFYGFFILLSHPAGLKDKILIKAQNMQTST